MTTKPQPIEIRQPDPELIGYLEKLLEQAKKGELVGIANVAIWQGQSVNSGWSGLKFGYLRTILGELDFLRRDLIENDR